MFTNTEAFSGFAVDDLEAAKKFYGETRRISSRRGRSGRGPSRCGKRGVNRCAMPRFIEYYTEYATR